ncbi:hypothetical protein [Parabacteroides sp. PF5-9]|uniref:hypothetical protein n=1 Tax=Parabacteroides sp. PF5-9 TaxID=1742404 RepID=UPI0024762874|nr:hypothetical protein [Parabacteroides sp. PF5-9]MDH6358581.1 hypothetical protein [Parabacteroides sp. PF5-9]
MKSKLLALILFILFISCKEDTAPVDLGGVRYSSIDISIFDKEGNDLLDPKNTNANAIKRIAVYHVINNELKHVYHSANSIFFSHEYYGGDNDIETDTYTKQYSTTVKGYYNFLEKETLTIVEWNNTDRDTLRYEWRESDKKYREIVTKVYVNDELKWQISDKSSRVILIK